jgi:hypothetical protein
LDIPHNVSPFLTVYFLGYDGLTRISLTGVASLSGVSSGSAGSGSAMLCGRGSEVLQPVMSTVLIVSSPKSMKKGTIIPDLGVVELFIIIFIPW